MKNIQKILKLSNPLKKYTYICSIAYKFNYCRFSKRLFSDNIENTNNKASNLVINCKCLNFTKIKLIFLDNDVKGAKQGDNSHYIIEFTCKKCDGRNKKMFTKKAYHHGIVVIKCDKCCSFHLIADNLGWFGDKKNIEDIMKEKNEEIIKLQVGGLFSLSNN